MDETRSIHSRVVKHGFCFPKGPCKINVYQGNEFIYWREM